MRILNRNTRAARREHFYVEGYNNIKYKNSPFYKGAELWDLLPLYITESETVFQFKQKLKPRYKIYCDTTV